MVGHEDGPDKRGGLMRVRLLAVLVPGALFTLSTGAAAEEFCVSCSGPEANYRCLIGGEATIAARSSRGQFLCITELAKAGGHASCSATRGQATPCPGETRTVMFSLADPGDVAGGLEARDLPPIGPSRVPEATLPPPAMDHPPEGAPPLAAENAAPAEEKKNVVETIASKTGKAVSDTGKAVGKAVKKSWDCVASFFGSC